jgi:hypothetical protein
MILNSIEKNNFEKEHISVEIAGENNIQDILEIQKERLLSDKHNVGELMESGFLVNPISESDIIEAINNSDNSYIFVAKNKIGEIVGYSLSYDFLHFFIRPLMYESCFCFSIFFIVGLNALISFSINSSYLAILFSYSCIFLLCSSSNFSRDICICYIPSSNFV